MIDFESMVIGFLMGQPTVTALVVDRIYADLPHERTYPLLRVQRTGGRFLMNRPQWLEQGDMTIDAYGGTRTESQQLASAVLVSLGTTLRGVYPQGIVTIVRGTAMAYNSDPDSLDGEGHGRPRFTVSAQVVAHP